MSWNYRIIYHKAEKMKEHPEIQFEEYLAVHEVYYDEDGNPNSIAKEPIMVAGEEGKDSLLSIKWTLEKITEAMNKPILNYDNLEEINKEKQNEFSSSIKKEE